MLAGFGSGMSMPSGVVPSSAVALTPAIVKVNCPLMSGGVTPDGFVSRFFCTSGSAVVAVTSYVFVAAAVTVDVPLIVPVPLLICSAKPVSGVSVTT